MKKLFETLLFLCINIAVSGQSRPDLSIDASFTVQEDPAELQSILDSAENYTRVPVHARYYEHPLNLQDAVMNQGDHLWKVAATGFNIRVYLYQELGPQDSLLSYDLSGKLLEKVSGSDIGKGNYITLASPGGVMLRLRSAGYSAPVINISGYSLSLPGDQKKNSFDFGDAGPCEVNIACPEGNNFRDVEKSIVRINVKLSNLEAWCTGTLINNTAQDFTPYIITAEHCGLLGSSFVGASDLARWEFYFNYQGDLCSDPASEGQLDFDRITGSELMARSDDNGGDRGSDFALLHLTDSIAFHNLTNPYFAGWNRTNTPPINGVTIHHPEGDIKKISTFSTVAISDVFNSSSPVDDTHWRVTWSPTITNHGVTEFGSSGCPLLDAQGLVNGGLTGGQASCFNNSAPDYYGKFSYSWESNGIAANRQLKPWLDPGNSGNFVMNGAYRGDSIIENPDRGDVELAPNPMSGDMLSVWNLGKNEIVDVYIFDIRGQLVFQREKLAGQPGSLGNPQLDLSRLSNGLYFVRVEQSGKKNLSFKVIISR